MNSAWRIVSFRVISFLALALLAGAQPKQRDLKYEENRPAAPSVNIPRGYALIVGVANYKNLPSKSPSSISPNVTPTPSTPS